MDSLHILTDEESYYAILFPTIIEYSNSHTYAKQQNECGQYYSKNKVFINNGDTFNGKYIIEYFQKTANIDVNDYTKNISETTFLNEINGLDTTKLNKILNETQYRSTLIENINIISSIGLLTKDQYNFLDKPSNTKKLSFLSNNYNKCSMFFKPHLVPLLQPKIKCKTNKSHLNLKIITTLFNTPTNKTHIHLKNCTIIENNNMSTKLMQCSATIFDITNGSESELQQAKMAFNYIYNELIKYSDKEITRLKENGIIRKFILISTVMTWVTDTSNYPIYEYEETYNNKIQENILERLPMTKYQIIFEFEKLILKSNSSKIKDIFKTYIISTGVIYGHEENALHNVFINARNNPKEMYVLMLNRTVPVFHIDELAKLVLTISKYDDYVKHHYVLAVEQELCSFNNIIKSVCDELCNSCLVLKEDNFIKKQYKFNTFTWDLICSNLIIDPMLDISLPDYQIQRKPIILNMKQLASEFIKATNLISLKLIIYGQNKHVTSNITELLSQYYQVPLINIPNLINNYIKSLENIQNELMLKINILYKQRTNIIQSLSKLSDPSQNKYFDCNDKFTNEMYFSDEQNNEEMITMDDRNHMFEKYEKSNISDDIFSELSESETGLNITNIKYSNYAQNSIYKLCIQNKKEKDLNDIDKEINNIKQKIDNLNEKYEIYKQYKNKQLLNLDKHLLLLINETLTSFSCHNQGYIFDIFPLSFNQMEYLIKNDIIYPNFIVLLINKNNSTLYKHKMVMYSTNNNGISKRYTLDHNAETEFNNLKYQKLNTYKRDVDYINSKNQTDIYDTRGRDNFKNDIAQIYKNNTEKYDVWINNNFVNYFTYKGINILRLTVPLEMADETRPYNNLQYQVFTDSIITRIGNSYSCYKSYIYTNNTIITTRQKILNKLNTMKQQWDNEIVKTLECKKYKYRKSIKIENFLKINILPKLLKEISQDNTNITVSQLPEKR